MVQKLDCRYCGFNLGYLKNGDVYEVRPGENHGPFPRVDDKGNPVNKQNIKRPKLAFKLTDRFQREVSAKEMEKVDTAAKRIVTTNETKETVIVEEPGTIVCGGCGKENPVF